MSAYPDSERLKRLELSEGAYKVALVALFTVGAAVRFWVGFTSHGVPSDIASLRIVSSVLTTHPLHVYESGRWPYPGGYLPVVWLADRLAVLVGAPFWAAIKLAPMLADLGIGVVVLCGLTRFHASRTERLLATGLVVLGPSFILISSYHGQIDACAVLPALLGVLLWDVSIPRRALYSGLLIGLAGAVKSVPLFMIFALLPTVRDRREAVTLVCAAIIVPLLSVLPFLVADTHPTVHALTVNKGIPGLGGLSLLLQPDLVDNWLHVGLNPPTHLVRELWNAQNLTVAVAVVVVSIFIFRRHLGGIKSACMIWLVVYVVNPNWAYEYFIWGLPFFLLARYSKLVFALQAALFLPAAIVYPRLGVRWHPLSGLISLRSTYAPIMDLVWLGFFLALVSMMFGTEIRQRIHRGQPSVGHRRHRRALGGGRASA